MTDATAGSMTGQGSATGPGPDACLRCGTTLHSIGTEEFRVGGTTGGWKLVFGEWAELGEDKLALEVRVCRACRHVDLRVPE